MFPDTILGWDLGGAHLKAVLLDAGGAAVSAVELPCPLWEGIGSLEPVVDAVLGRLPSAPRLHAVTMTGELADCFPNRAAGVSAIARALAAQVPAERTRFFAGRRGFVPAAGVAGAESDIASANWLATAHCVASSLAAALLVDIGSTTADLVPVAAGGVRASAHDDFERLAADELVYTGVVRTPLMALADRAPIEGRAVGVMAEHFATTADIYRITGDLSADADLHASADGGPKTVEASARRLARMVGRDAASAPFSTWKSLAEHFGERQLARLQEAATRVILQGDLPADAPLVGAGVGSFLARRLAARLGRGYIDFASQVPRNGATADAVMACAPAYAVARLLGMSSAPAPS
jgi:probable H4MPT-linked C1 transfer pathway protein